MSEIEKLKKVNLSITKKYTASKKMVEDKMKTISDQKSIIKLFKGTEDVLKSTIKNLESKIKGLMGEQTPYPRGQVRSSSQNNHNPGNLIDQDFSVSILDSSKFSKNDSYRHLSRGAHTQHNLSEKFHLNSQRAEQVFAKKVLMDKIEEPFISQCDNLPTTIQVRKSEKTIAKPLLNHLSIEVPISEAFPQTGNSSLGGMPRTYRRNSDRPKLEIITKQIPKTCYGAENQNPFIVGGSNVGSGRGHSSKGSSG